MSRFQPHVPLSGPISAKRALESAGTAAHSVTRMSAPGVTPVTALRQRYLVTVLKRLPLRTLRLVASQVSTAATRTSGT
jgi:hypothetical protein